MTMKATRVYDFAMTALGSFSLPVTGSFFRILTSTGAVSVQGDFGNVAPISAGQGLRDQPFTRLELTDRSGVANVGTIIVSDGAFVDDRISGEVSVIDGEKSRTIAGGMFGGTSFCAAAAATACIQLWNPAASGKNLIVIAVEIGAPANTSVRFGQTTGQLASVYAAAGNKKSTGPAASALVLYESKVVPPVLVSSLRLSYLAANVMIPWSIKGAIVIQPGYGLMATATGSIDLLGNFEWFEEVV